jgi:hypothetical protein
LLTFCRTKKGEAAKLVDQKAITEVQTLCDIFCNLRQIAKRVVEKRITTADTSYAIL